MQSVKHTINQDDYIFRYIDEYHLVVGGDGFVPPAKPIIMREPQVCKECEKTFLSLYQINNCEYHNNNDLDPVRTPTPIKRPYRNLQKMLELKVEIANERGYFCELCGSDKDIEMRHIQDFHNHPELGYEKDNVILLCSSCHTSKTEL